MKTISVLLCATFLSVASVAAEAVVYDPLVVGKAEVRSERMEVRDAKRERTVPIRVYFPGTDKPAPVILFSHGLGGSRDNNPYLGSHWAGRGYVVVFVQHPGSDEGVWKDVPPVRRMAALKKAAGGEEFMDRVEDVPTVLDALEVWNTMEGHALEGRLDPGRVGMSGHSFGALTTQAMAGQDFGGGRVSFGEKRIDAAVMMSPSRPRRGNAAAAFDEIEMPCLLLTGTRDDNPIGDGTAEERLEVFANLRKAPAWQVVFDGATHGAFSERKTRGWKRKGDRYHTAILALTTAFWDAHLSGDKAALEWLNGEGAKSALDPKDKWEINARAR